MENRLIKFYSNNSPMVVTPKPYRIIGRKLMKKFTSLAVIAGMLILLVGAGRNVDANSQPQLLTGILNKMEKAHLDLKSLKAELVLQKTNTQIGVTDSEYGQLLYKPGANKSKQKLRSDSTKAGKD